MRTAGYRVVEIARMLRFARDAGVKMPPDKLKVFTGATLRPASQKVLIDGVWRDKPGTTSS